MSPVPLPAGAALEAMPGCERSAAGVVAPLNTCSNSYTTLALLYSVTLTHLQTQLTSSAEAQRVHY